MWLTLALVVLTASSTEPASGPSSAPIVEPSADMDAEPQSSEPTAKVTTKLGRGVTITSADERWRLNIRGRFQLRTLIEGGAPGERSISTALMIRRARLVLNGYVYNPHFQYYVQLGFAYQDMEPDLLVPLRDAYATYTGVRDLQLRIGQMKVPFDRQRVISSGSLEFTDRSIVVTELSLDRDVGVYAFSNNLFGLNHWLGYRAGVFAGDGRNRFFSRDGLLFIGRLIIAPLGEIEDDEEADLKRRERPSLQFAGAFAYNDNSARSQSTQGTVLRGGFDYLHAEADIILRWQGISFLAEMLWRQSDQPSRVVTTGGVATREYARSAVGYFVQAGAMIYEGLQVAARYSDLYPLLPANRAESNPALLTKRELGGSISYYLAGHHLKLQADYFYNFAAAFSGGSHAVRIQTQVAF